MAILTVETDEKFGHIFDGDHAAVVQAWRCSGRLATSATVDATTTGRVQRLLSDKGADGRSSVKSNILVRDPAQVYEHQSSKVQERFHGSNGISD